MKIDRLFWGFFFFGWFPLYFSLVLYMHEIAYMKTHVLHKIIEGPKIKKLKIGRICKTVQIGQLNTVWFGPVLNIKSVRLRFFIYQNRFSL